MSAKVICDLCGDVFDELEGSSPFLFIDQEEYGHRIGRLDFCYHCTTILKSLVEEAITKSQVRQKQTEEKQKELLEETAENA